MATLRDTHDVSSRLGWIVLLGLATGPLGGAGCSGIKTCPSAGPAECPGFGTPNLHQATCSIIRTECAGWVEDLNSTVDSINCFGTNLIENMQLTATICYDSNTRTATQACNDYCGSGYPLAPEIGNGRVTCQSTVAGDVVAVTGQ